MFRRLILPLLLVSLTAPPAFAQSLAAEAPALTRPTATSTNPDDPHRIFTLAWTEIRIPHDMALAASTPSASAEQAPRGLFILRWTEAAASSANDLQQPTKSPACQQMILVAVPCEGS